MAVREELQLHIFSLRQLDGVKVLTKKILSWQVRVMASPFIRERPTRTGSVPR